jgi:hypothetical protein
VQGATIIRHTSVVPGTEQTYSAWRGKLTVALSAHPGFRNLEVHPPDESQPDWGTIEHFATMESAQAWLQSPIRAELAHEVAQCVSGPDSLTVVHGSAAERPQEVTAVINNRVKPGREIDFRNWLERIQVAQSGFPGYRGVTLQPPIDGVNPAWVSLLRFDTAENLRGWLSSRSALP